MRQVLGGAAMDASQLLISFFLAALATWRLTHLIANEDGPADSIARVRARLAGTVWGTMIACFGCLSLWVAIPLALFVSVQPLEALVAWLALSGAALLLERLGPEPIVIERSINPDEGDETHGMLRPEAPDPNLSGADHAGAADR
ncbi:MAG TPA: hypothetical protein VK456_11710 [Xanthobacteraceae bacterium]|nr:hypothetical protein [Xanthobacteraceae bacterium]